MYCEGNIWSSKRDVLKSPSQTAKKRWILNGRSRSIQLMSSLGMSVSWITLQHMGMLKNL